MGYIKHDAIIVTTWDEKYLSPAMDKAIELGLPCSGVTESKINGYVSFLIAPDGSKEGWGNSDAGNIARENWKSWAKEQTRKNDLWIEWVHVSYAGDEETDTRIVEHHNGGGEMSDIKSLVEELRERARIRRQIPSRKSVREGKPDRIADLLERAAAALDAAINK